MNGYYFANLHKAVVAARELLKWDTEAHDRFDSYWRTLAPAASSRTYWEGRLNEAAAINRARNGRAWRLCIQHWCCVCYVCNFDFVAFYGHLGEGFIEVHHLTPMAFQPDEEYAIDPITDLRPFAPSAIACCTGTD